MYNQSIYREQMQAEKDRARQLKQMQDGTSAQAKRDIARLDQIKREREDAAKRRDMERKGSFSNQGSW